MEFAKAGQYTARISDKYYVSENERFLYIKLELLKPDRIEFLTGQYVSVKVSEKGLRRSYSIASTPDDNHGVHIMAEMIPTGLGSKFWKSRQPGDQIELLGPLGRFVIDVSTDRAANVGKKRLFVATGSGIAPIWSMINDLLINKKEKGPVRLHWGMRSEADLFWVDNLERLAEAHPNFVYDIVLSRPSEEWELCSGHVQDCLRRDFPTGDLAEWEGYVCGSPKAVTSIALCLEELKMDPEKIYYEKFA